MITVLNAVEEWIKGFLADLVCGILSNIFKIVAQQTNGLIDDLALNPESYNASMWSMLQSVIRSAVVPVAALVLTYVMCIELIGWLNDRNNLNTSGDVMATLIKYVIKLFIGILLIQNAHVITLEIFKVANTVITEAIGTVNTNVAVEMLSDSKMQELKESLITLNLGDLLGMILITGLAFLITFIINGAAQMIIIGRVIQIYMYCSIGSVPYATLINKELSGIGKNYLLNLAALAFQGFFMVIAIAMYGYLISDVDFSEMTGGLVNMWGMTKYLLRLLVCSGALVFTLIGSKSLSKSIFNAH